MDKLRIFFFMLRKVNLYDLTGASQVFHEAGEMGLPAEVHFCTNATAVTSTEGLPMGPIPHFRRMRPETGDFLFIASSDIHDLLSPRFDPGEELLDWIRQSHERGVTVYAVCNGAFLAGMAGLLDGRRCTTHWKRTAELQQRFPQARVQDNILFAEDSGVCTSAGGASAVDLALSVVSKVRGDHLAFRISRELVVYMRRSGSHQQQSELINHRHHVHTGIHRVQDWLQENLDQPVTLDQLADMACMSYRNFSRVFKKETGLTVIGYINRLRREKISRLMKNPNLSRRQIARACGLESERQVSRILHHR